jgi:plasmid stabilization system protein ParE
MKLIWSQLANRQIDEIFEYYKSVSGLRTAQGIVRKLYTCAEVLVKNPQGGQRESWLDDCSEEYRRLVDGNYKIIYVVEDEKVSVVGIFDTRRNPDMLYKIVK